jgi:phosphatidylinositol 3-kinase
MCDAGIPDLSTFSDPETALARVEERFRLDLTDEQAELHFAALISDSLTALAPRLMEIAHQFAVSRR